MNKKILIAAMLGFFSLSANAELQSVDLYKSGDGLVTIDTDTGIEWMDLSVVSNQLTYNEKISLLGEDEFKGWRLPTSLEVTSMLRSHFDGFNHITNSGWVDDSNALSRELRGLILNYISLFGYSCINGKTNEASAMFLDENGDLDIFVTRYSVSNRDPLMLGLNYAAPFIGKDTVQVTFSTFFVSDGGASFSSKLDPTINENNANARYSDVPVSFTFGGLLLAGLAFFRKRKA